MRLTGLTWNNLTTNTSNRPRWRSLVLVDALCASRRHEDKLLQVFLAIGCIVSAATAITPSPTVPAIPQYKYCSAHPSYEPFGMECSGIKQCDANNDGKVTEAELFKGYNTTFPDPEYFRAYFTFRDLNLDGVVDQQDEPLMWDRMDEDKDGRVDLGEYFTEYQMVRHGMPYLFMSQPDYIKGISNTFVDLDRARLEHLLDYIPHKADGSVEKNEFIKTFKNKFKMWQFEAEKHFASLDKDGNDVITTCEMWHRFPELDSNGDNKIQAGEVIQLGDYHKIFSWT